MGVLAAPHPAVEVEEPQRVEAPQPVAPYRVVVLLLVDLVVVLKEAVLLAEVLKEVAVLVGALKEVVVTAVRVVAAEGEMEAVMVEALEVVVRVDLVEDLGEV